MEYRVITSGFYKTSRGNDAADDINQVIKDLGPGWKITNFTVSTLDNPANLCPLVCYSALAIKEKEEENEEDKNKNEELPNENDVLPEYWEAMKELGRA